MTTKKEFSLPVPFHELSVERQKDESLSVYDADGELVLYDLPAHWQRHDVVIALDIKRKAFKLGQRVGRNAKAYEIRLALAEEHDEE